LLEAVEVGDIELSIGLLNDVNEGATPPALFKEGKTACPGPDCDGDDNRGAVLGPGVVVADIGVAVSDD